jgi:hypothetical protein
VSEITWHIENGELFIDGKQIDLPLPVGNVIKYNKLFIVRVAPFEREIFNRNIFAITEQREIIWQIHESPHGTEQDKPYMNIMRNKDGSVIASNWNGVDYIINIKDGSITPYRFSK